ncbi:MAG TPA: hypothetical protein VMG40_03850 [Bryobacteraceae bacterium]|nr:hypothetical protein [Bryobacteraceae bacterium]
MLFSSVSAPSENSIVLSGEGGRVVIEVDSYERSGAPDFHDANWLTASVSVTAGSFAGSFSISIGTYELVELYRRLSAGLENLSGTVSFENLETDLMLNIEFLDRGKVRISGEAHPRANPSGRMAFSFDSDQSYLGHTLEQMRSILRQFPVKQ